MSDSLFPLGKITATPGALSVLEEAGQDPTTFLKRHVNGDWGDCVEEDKLENNLSVTEGFRIMSVYKIHNDLKIWIITESDGTYCIVLPQKFGRNIRRVTDVQRDIIVQKFKGIILSSANLRNSCLNASPPQLLV